MSVGAGSGASSTLVADGVNGITDSGWIFTKQGYDFSVWGHGATVEVQVSPLSSTLEIPALPGEFVSLGSLVFAGDPDPAIGPLTGPLGEENEAVLAAMTLPFLQIRFVLTAGTGKVYFTRFN